MIQLPPNYPKAHSVIKPANRSLSKAQQAVNAVNQTAHKAAILSLGGVAAVAALIWGAMQALGNAASIFLMMMKMQQLMMQQMMQQMQSGMTQTQFSALLAIVSALV